MSGLGDAYFKRARRRKEGDARKPDFRRAGDAYAKAVAVQSDDADLAFNAALVLPELPASTRSRWPQWQNVLKLRPTDVERVVVAGRGASPS